MKVFLCDMQTIIAIFRVFLNTTLTAQALWAGQYNIITVMLRLKLTLMLTLKGP